MDILIIGGTGVLSSAVVNVALKQGLKVTMINRGRRKNLIPEGVDVIVADKKDTKRIQSILKNRIFDAMNVINEQTLTAPVRIGDVVVPHLLGYDCDVIVTKNVDKA